MRRRDFLKLTALVPPTLLFPRLALPAAAPRWDRVLVLLELNGGNDGLNTVVPYGDTQYYRLRPQLALARDAVLPLDERLALNPVLEPLMPAWRAHELSIVLGVGYPRPNRSHFRSIEIWDTGSGSDEVLQEGWIARVFAAAHPPQTHVADGIVIGRTAGPLNGRATRTLVMQDAERFMRAARRIQQPAATSPNPALAHMLNVQNDLYAAAGTLQDKLAHAPTFGASFPNTRIGRQLQTIASLLASGTPVAVVKTAHGSFDTHSQQRGQHDRLLAELASALADFRQAMQSAGLWDRIMVLTYSEFGRRAAENGSRGTDHGTSAPHFVLGGRVKGGLYGQQPSLARLVDGDLQHHVDYRSLYATVAQHWWGIRENVFGQRYPLIDFIT